MFNLRGTAEGGCVIGLLLNPNLSQQDIQQLLDNQRARDEKRDQDKAEERARFNQKLADEEDDWRKMWREGREEEVIRLRRSREEFLRQKKMQGVDFFLNVEWLILLMRMFG